MRCAIIALMAAIATPVAADETPQIGIGVELLESGQPILTRQLVVPDGQMTSIRPHDGDADACNSDFFAMALPVLAGNNRILMEIRAIKAAPGAALVLNRTLTLDSGEPVIVPLAPQLERDAAEMRYALKVTAKQL